MSKLVKHLSVYQQYKQFIFNFYFIKNKRINFTMEKRKTKNMVIFKMTFFLKKYKYKKDKIYIRIYISFNTSIASASACFSSGSHPYL